MLDLQRFKQWVQLSDDISAVQRFTAFRGENQIQQVRPPSVQERPEVSRERSRDCKLPGRIGCLRSLNHVAPHCLPDADNPNLQVNVLDSQPKQFPGSHASFGRKPVKCSVRILRCPDDSLYLFDREKESPLRGDFREDEPIERVV